MKSKNFFFVIVGRTGGKRMSKRQKHFLCIPNFQISAREKKKSTSGWWKKKNFFQTEFPF
jgi:hypothetical protein